MPILRFLFTLILCATGATAATADAIWLRSPSGGQEYAVQGVIVDYTGERLTIRQPGGREKRYPTERVVRIETTHTPAQVAGRKFLREKKWSAAARQLAVASREESRQWVRRQVLEELMQCYEAQGQSKQAGDLMIAIASSDPATLAWRHAPLPWFAADDIPASDARAWLAQSEESARLLGAAWLLGGADRTLARAELRTLTRSQQPAIARLAEAQLWRLDLQQASSVRVDRWASRVKLLPRPLRSGPQHLLAQAYLRQKRYDEAALAALEAPLAGRASHRLAARGLLLAARALHKGGHADEAQTLLAEIIRDYADTPWRQDAQALQSN